MPTLSLFRQLQILRDELERVRTQIAQLCDALGKPMDGASLDLREQLQRSISFLEQAADHLVPDANHKDQPAASE